LFYCYEPELKYHCIKSICLLFYYKVKHMLSINHFEIIWISNPRCSFATKGCGLHVSEVCSLSANQRLPQAMICLSSDGAPVTSGNLSTYICTLCHATACPVSHYLYALLLPAWLCKWVRAAYICSL